VGGIFFIIGELTRANSKRGGAWNPRGGLRVPPVDWGKSIKKGEKKSIVNVGRRERDATVRRRPRVKGPLVGNESVRGGVGSGKNFSQKK